MTPAPPPIRPPAVDGAVVVAGGRGLVGGAIVAALRARGSRVVVPTRSPAGAAHGPVDEGTRVVPVASWEDPHELRAVLAEPGWHPVAAVAAIGGWWLGPDLVALEPAVWRRLVESHLTGHFLVVRALAPLLTGPAPAYLLLNGAAATEPMAGSGPVSVTGAAQRMLLEVLRAESLGARVRFHEVTVTVAVAGDDRNVDPAHTVPADQVARVVLGVLDDPAAPPVMPVEPLGADQPAPPAPPEGPR